MHLYGNSKSRKKSNYLWAHVACGDQLRSVFKSLVVLFQDFDQRLAFSWTQTTNELH